MAKKKTTEAINREQEVMEEKEALPHFSLTCFPLPATRSLTERCWSTQSCIRHR